jgi:chitinase
MSARRAGFAVLLVVALLGMLAGAPGAALAQAPVPTLSIGDATVAAEGTTGATQLASFTISLSAASASDVTVRYVTTNASAVAPGDYAAVALTQATIQAGQTSTTVTVTVNGDALDEPDETFDVTLSTPTNATILDATGVGTIVDDDPPAALSVSDPNVAEGGANLVFTVTLAPVSGRDVTVAYATADGSATSTGLFDYTPTSGTLTFAPGVTSQTVSVPITNDSTDEADETVFLDLTLPAGSPATITKARGTGTIVDDDGPTISIDDVTLAPEGAPGTTQDATFTILLSAPSTQPVTVRYATNSGTAVAPADYAAVVLTTVTFAPGETSKQVSVTVNGDALDEVDETFTVQLSSPTGGTILDPSGTATIPDDDPLPALSVSDPTVIEGTGSTRTLVFTVTLAPVSGRTVNVNYATADGSAVSTGATTDYTPSTGTRSFLPGQTTLTVSVALVTDPIDELDETLFLDLTLPTDSPATITKARGTGTISDDDGPTIAIGNVTLAEGDSGSTNATFTIALSATSVQPVSVKVATANETAAAPGDYTALPAGTVATIAVGQTTTTVTVPVNGDTLDEADERFRVTLSDPVGGTITGANPAFGTITDDDAAPTIRVDDVSVGEGSVGNTNVVLTVALNRPSERTVTVDYATADVTATVGIDYGEASDTLTFAPGITRRTVTLPIGADAAVENDETFTFTLSGAVNASIERAVATVTIVDDDLSAGTTPSLSVADVTVPGGEGDSGSKPATITVRLSNPTGRSVGVSYATADGTATAPADYAATSGRLEFAPGETTQTFVVAIQGDEIVESDHSFKVTLSQPANATISDGSAIVTIDDDDVGLGKIDAPASINASKVFCARRKGCPGLAFTWTVLTRGELVFELTALAPRKVNGKTTGVKVISVLKTSSTVTKARTSRKLLRPTPGTRTRRLLRRLRTLKADALRLKVTFLNRSGEAESRTVRIKLNVRR